VKEKEIILSTSFHAGGALKSEMTVVKNQLRELPHLKILSDGNTLKYELLKTGVDKNNGLLELTDSSITLSFFFKKPESSSYKDNLVSFICILVYLKEFYDIRFSDLYSYIVEALNQNWHNVVKDQNKVFWSLKERINVLNKSNCTLSNQIVDLSRKNHLLSIDLALYKEFSRDILYKVEQMGGHSGGNHGILATFGIDPDSINKVESSLKENRD
jgi:hypothetical protein